jgi:hypothetical protein
MNELLYKPYYNANKLLRITILYSNLNYYLFILI